MRQITIPNSLKIVNNHESLMSELIKIIEDQVTASKIIICSSGTAHELLGSTLYSDLSAHLKKGTVFNSSIDFSQGNITERIKSNLHKDFNIVIGVGGGKILDYSKYLASEKNKINPNVKFISIPTLISHDGICSPVAVLEGQSLAAIMPTALIAPLHIIKQAPLSYLRAGIGDLIANLSAIEDWQLASQFNGEDIDDFAMMLSKKSANSILQRLNAELNIQNNNIEEYLLSDDFLSALTESLTLSGIAMSISGNSRPCSGAEHMISHAIDQIYGHGVKALHGIQVAIATVYLEELRGQEKERYFHHNYPLKNILSLIACPSSFTELGINEMELTKIIELAPKTRVNRYSILSQKNILK